MAMKKGDMERHQTEYRALMGKAQAAKQQGLYRKAVEFALSSWEHIDGMMQYERRYEDGEFVTIDAIDVVLDHAPLLFDFDSLNTLESLLKGQRRIDKNTSESLADQLAKARTLMWDARRMWDHLEHHPEVREDELARVLGGNKRQWRSVGIAWEEMGLLHRIPEGGSYRLALSTRMGEVISGKCPACGSVAEAPKAMLLEKTACPQCRTAVLFVLLSNDTASGTKE